MTSTHVRLARSNAAPAQTGIVHLGAGAFFRAFNAAFTAEAMTTKGGDWGIVGVSLRSADIRNKLAPQGFAYSIVTLAPDGPSEQVNEVINDLLVAPEDPHAVLVAMTDETVKIVSLTITEKGYCVNPATGRLRMDDSDIVFDLANPDAPRTAVGFIVHALSRRKALGVPPFTVLSCDNMPSNGDLTGQVVLDFARLVDPALGDWIGEHCRFPNTMVDRITPATTDQDVANLGARTGTFDPACVMTEPFRQWVIEDDFVGDARPQWDAAGATFVKDVSRFELMKLRCLNGTHSTLAYLGYLAGYETIADTVADPVFANLIRHLWRSEILPTLAQPEGVDLKAYCTALHDRYRNPSIRHNTWQIAMDGSQKLPQRLLGTITDNLGAGRDISGLALAVAGWMRYVSGVDENGGMIDVRDPLAARLKQISNAAKTPADKADALLGITEVFEPSLSRNDVFRKAVTTALTTLYQHGARKAVQEFS